MDRWERDRQKREQLDLKKVEILNSIRFKLHQKHGLMLSENGQKIEDEWIGPEFTYEQTGDFYRAYNGKIRVYIDRPGAYGRKKCFRMKKDGSVDIDGIVQQLFDNYEYAKQLGKQEEAAREKEADNKNTVEAIAQKYGISKWATNLDVDYKYGEMSFKVNGLSAKQADAFVRLAVDLGLIKTNL